MSEAWPWGRLLAWPAPRGPERRLTLEADPEVRAQVARDLELEDVERLGAGIVVRPWLDGMEIEGRVEALVTRLCGVSLEPFEVAVDEPLKVRIVPLGSPNAPQAEAEVVVDLEAEDPPDEAAAEGVDPGAYVVETLALSLDPFPRKPGVVFEQPQEPEASSPFAALADLVKRPPAN
ncbi:MAG TPA: DUF177 domain-containing protein [Caulobacteraceae bacterium]|nr:DUF177 domain-containing protein [Caulobacteraceae bacterium]